MNEPITLIPVTEATIKGAVVETEHPEEARDVFALPYSVGESEFYRSQQMGYRLAIKLKLWREEYQGERRVIYRGKKYEVTRTYDAGEKIELTCELVAAKG